MQWKYKIGSRKMPVILTLIMFAVFGGLTTWLYILKWFVRLIKKIVKWIWHLHKAFWGAIFGMLSKKTGMILGTMFFGYTAIISLFSVFTIASFSAIWVLLGVALFGLAFVMISRRSKDLDEIKKGVHEVRNGNVSYKIPEVKCDDLKRLATNINDIAIGLDESVSAQVIAVRDLYHRVLRGLL